MTTPLLYKRVLLKVSGEGLAGKNDILDKKALARMAKEMQSLIQQGVELCVVVGGGNIVRGRSCADMERCVADAMGMHATIINALALKSALQAANVPACVYSAVPMGAEGQLFQRKQALESLKKGEVVIFAGGTGLPYFSTDTASVLRARQMRCDAFLKATQVDGIYTADVRKNPKAKRYAKVSYDEVIAKQLGVMDLTAVVLAKEGKLPVVVFKQSQPSALKNIVRGQGVFTLMNEKGK